MKEFQKEKIKEEGFLLGFIAAAIAGVLKMHDDSKKASENSERAELASLNGKLFLSESQRARKAELKKKYPGY